jgi:hypothetical protein
MSVAAAIHDGDTVIVRSATGFDKRRAEIRWSYDATDALRIDPLDDRRDPLADPDAHRGQAEAAAGPA